METGNKTKHTLIKALCACLAGCLAFCSSGVLSVSSAMAAKTESTGDFTTIKPVIHVAQNFDELTYTATELNISWEKTDSADGYRLYRRIGDTGKFTRIKTYKKNTRLSYTDTDVARGSHYYYRMRAFQWAGDGSKIFTRRTAVTDSSAMVSLEPLYTEKNTAKRLAAIAADLNGTSVSNDELRTNFNAIQCLGSAKYIYYQLFGYSDFCTYSSDGINYTMSGNRFTPVFEHAIPDAITADELKTLFETAYAGGSLTAGCWLQYSYLTGSTTCSQHSSIFMDFTPEKDGIVVFDGNFCGSIFDSGTKNHSLLLKHSLTYEYLAKLLSNSSDGITYKRGIALYYLGDDTTPGTGGTATGSAIR